MIFWGSSLSWLMLMLTILIDLIFVFALSFFYSGYSNTRDVISLLGNPSSPVKIFFNIWLIILGLLICISAVNFYIVYSSISTLLAAMGSIILFCFGIGTGIIGGTFSIDEKKEFNTTSSVLHGIGAGIGFAALSFMPLIIGLISFKNGNDLTGTSSIIFFVLCFIFSILFVLSEKNFFKKPIINFNGLWQRLLLICMYMPLLLIAVNFIMVGIKNI